MLGTALDPTAEKRHIAEQTALVVGCKWWQAAGLGPGAPDHDQGALSPQADTLKLWAEEEGGLATLTGAA